MQAIAEGEVPVGCVFVRNPGNGTDAYIIARGSNKTNKFRNVCYMILLCIAIYQ